MGSRADGRRGTALYTVLVIIFVASSLAAVFSAASMQRIHMARMLGDTARAVAYAEAGVNRTYSALMTDWGKVTNASASEYQPTAFGQGAYDVCARHPVTTNGVTLTNMALIVSTGTCRRATESVILSVQYLGGPGPWNTNWGDAFDYAILTEGTFYFRGCGNISATNGSAKLHANRRLDIRGNCGVGLDIESSQLIDIGNNITINGAIESPTNRYTPSKVTITGGATTDTVPPKTVPDLNLDRYASWANQNTEYKPNGWSWSGGTYNANGGVIWVNGDVQLSGQSTINGTIIATGNIHVSGNVNVNASIYGIALASRDQSIIYTSSGTTKGLIYVRLGGYTQTANGNVQGQIISKGAIDKGGNSDILVFTRYIPTLPPGAESPSTLEVTAWQK
jgi:cytoskeletal protein CcmA (bactofilin family)